MVRSNQALLRSRLERVLGHLDRRPAASAFALLAIVFLMTARWSLPYHIDPLTNVLTAWKLGTSGSVVLEEYETVTGPDFFNVANQLVATPRGPVSKYPPGTALLAAPLYSFADGRDSFAVTYNRNIRGEREQLSLQLELPQRWPAAVVASLATAGAMAALAAALQSTLGRRWAWISALIIGLGTSLWSVAADALWQHGPAALGLALGLLGVSRHRYLLGSAGFAFAVLVRPQTAVIVALVGIWAAIRERSVMTLIRTGVVPGLAAVAYLIYNRWAFGQLIEQQAGGYWVGGTLRRSWWDTLESIGGAFVSPGHGLLFWSPFIALALVGAVRTWPSTPWWIRAAAIGGLVFLVVQVRGNGYVGGEGFRWYRYQLEAMLAAAPLIVCSLHSLWSINDHWRRAIILTVGTGVYLHGYAAIFGGLA